MHRRTRQVGLALIGAVAVGTLAALFLHHQVRRHQRDLFSPNSFQRLAALGHIAKEPASVDRVMLLKDFLAWEPRKVLRNRAAAILSRMEHTLERGVVPDGAPV